MKIVLLDKFVDVINRVMCISIVNHIRFQNVMFKVKIKKHVVCSDFSKLMRCKSSFSTFPSYETIVVFWLAGFEYRLIISFVIILILWGFFKLLTQLTVLDPGKYNTIPLLIYQINSYPKISLSYFDGN